MVKGLRKNVKSNKGITLIALIITIIVLLILAGIVLAMVVGDNSIIAKAQRARQETENAQDTENTMMARYQDAIDEIRIKTIATNARSI